MGKGEIARYELQSVFKRLVLQTSKNQGLFELKIFELDEMPKLLKLHACYTCTADYNRNFEIIFEQEQLKYNCFL